MKNLYPFQEEAIEKIIEFYNSSMKNAKISLSIGLGKSHILVNAIAKILKANHKCKILLLCGTENKAIQYYEKLMSEFNTVNVIEFLPDLNGNGIFIESYSSILRDAAGFDYNKFNLIICDDLNFLNDEYKYPFFENSYTGKRLCITIPNEKNKLPEKDKLIFDYNIINAVENGYFTTTEETSFIKDFLLTFLTKLGFKNIELEKKYGTKVIDIVATKNREDYAFEIKTYRTKYASQGLVERATHIFRGRIQSEEKINFKPIMITNCKVDLNLKEEILSKTKIEIWDISNLIYLCGDSSELIQKLSLYSSFSILDIRAERTLSYSEIQENIDKPEIESQYQKFEKLFNQCKPGREDEKKYEKICEKAIKYLFKTEFFQISSQYSTNDNIFRMDLITSLKGTTEFWKFLIQFFNTKFVVFEFKNYSEEISQNLIFITGKYLYPSALRNVAFIISRYGLDKNANLIVDSKIKDEKKLIISLTDKDILIMIALKEEGKEPSDYLLEKVEKMLMSLSI